MQDRSIRVGRRPGPHSFFALCFAAALVSSAQGSVYTWTGASPNIGGNNFWSNPLNWSGFLGPVNNGTADVHFGVSSRTLPKADVPWDIHGITFNLGASTYTLSGSGLTLQGGGITNDSVVTQTIANDLTLGDSQTWIAHAGGININGGVALNASTLTVSGDFGTSLNGLVTGSGSLSKSGAGALLLNAANTFFGSTTISGGSIVLGDGAALQGSLVSVLVNNGINFNGQASVTLGALGGSGALNLGSSVVQMGAVKTTTTYSGTISGSGSLVKNGVGVFNVTGGTAASPSTLHRLAVNDGTVNLSGAHVNASSTSLTLTGDEAVFIGNGTLNLTSGAVLNGAANSRIDMDGSTSNLLVTDAGSEIHCGFQFTIGVNNPATAVVQNGGRLSSDTYLLVGLQNSGVSSLTVQGGGHVSGGISGLGIYSGATGDATVTGTGSDWTTGSFGLGGLDPAHDGGTGHLVISNGGSVTVSGITTLWNDASTLVIDKGTLTTQGLSSTSGNNVIQVSNPVGGTALTVGVDGLDSTYSGRIMDGPSGAGGLKKVGFNTLTLTNFNTYTGRTTVAGGGLVQNGGGSMGSFTVNPGSWLFLQGGAQVNLGFGEIVANGAVDYDNVTVNGGFLRGGSHFIEAGGATFNGTTMSSSGVLAQNFAATLNNFTNGGHINNSATLTAGNLYNTSSGVLNVNSTVNASELVSDGVINVAAGGVLNSSDTSLTLGGGSRTYVGTKASPGGTLDLGGQTLELNGGLLVNNGTIQGGMVNVNFGGLAKGAGNYAGGYSVNDGGKIIFGNSPGTLTSGSAVWGAGGSFDFQINDANGVSGTNWSLNKINGTLTVGAGTTEASRFNVNLQSLLANNSSGSLLNFDGHHSYAWTFVSTTGGIVGFDASEFNLDTSGFLNDLRGGSFRLGVDGNNLDVFFTPVPEPSAIVGLGLGLVGVLRRRRR